MSKVKTIMLADMESFYASVEIVKDASLQGKPVAVCGDPEQRHGIILAANKQAKAYGIKTGMLAGECARLCPNITLVRPHMQDYLNMSLQITKILETFTDRVFPYSIDEQFLDMTGCEGLFGSAEEMARLIIKKIREETGLNCRVGIGENPLQAKMACDRFAKKNSQGFFRLSHSNYAELTWPLPVRDLFGVGARMERHFFNSGIRTIGHLALFPREDIKRRWGISGEVLWLNAHGIDYTTVETPAMGKDSCKSIGCSLTLPRDYRYKREIEAVLLEITEEVCYRARALGKVGRVVTLYCRSADFDFPSGFSRQAKMFEATAITLDMYSYVLKLFYAHWDRRPVRKLGINLSSLMDSAEMQLSLLERKEKKVMLSRAMDSIKHRYGPTSLFRLSSLTQGGLLFARATKIGGHEA